LRAWLYKIATNACLDELAARKRPQRGLPTTVLPAADPARPPEPPLTEYAWLEPIPHEWLADLEPGPEAHYTARESISLAFIAALQALPPRQRAVLILSDVLDWRAREIAELLGLTVSAVNSALHRARATLIKRYHTEGTEAVTPLEDERLNALLSRYVQAWEMADVAGLVALLKEDAAFTMPPSPSWYRGQADIRVCLLTNIFAGDAAGRWRLRPTHANGQPAFGFYRRDEAGGTYQAFGLQVLHWEGDRLREITTFLDPALLTRFGLPTTWGHV
jgi:RNA polymerase sigma-70 factor (ECF subfamily)